MFNESGARPDHTKRPRSEGVSQRFGRRSELREAAARQKRARHFAARATVKRRQIQLTIAVSLLRMCFWSALACSGEKSGDKSIIIESLLQTLFEARLLCAFAPKHSKAAFEERSKRRQVSCECSNFGAVFTIADLAAFEDSPTRCKSRA